jgi:hypothetical protein
MKVRRIKKTAATIGLVFATILISFTLGLAQDSAPLGPRYSLGLQPGVPDDASCVDHASRVGLAPKPSDSSMSWVRTWPQASVPSSLFAVRNPLFISAITVRKISLYLRDSALLI